MTVQGGGSVVEMEGREGSRVFQYLVMKLYIVCNFLHSQTEIDECVRKSVNVLLSRIMSSECHGGRGHTHRHCQ